MEFREMRRKDFEFDLTEALELMKKSTYSIVAFNDGDNGYPYAIPAHVAYFDGAMWFHGFNEGLKHETLAKCNRVCVTTVFDCEIIPSNLSSHYTSLMTYGRAYIVPDDEYVAACRKFGMYFAGEFKSDVDRASVQYEATTRMIKIEIDHMAAKQKRD